METAWHLLLCYFAQTPIKEDERPEGVEVTVEADLGKHGLTKLVGIVDLIRAGGTIVDFKTSGQTPNANRAVHLHETQLASRRSGGFESAAVFVRYMARHASNNRKNSRRY